MAMAEFLKDLPTRNAENFTKINPDSCHRLNAFSSQKVVFAHVCIQFLRNSPHSNQGADLFDRH